MQPVSQVLQQLQTIHNTCVIVASSTITSHTLHRSIYKLFTIYTTRLYM